MTDDRMFAGFRGLDAPVDPDPVFAERLFESVVADLGFREETTGRRRGLRRRVRRAVGLENRPVGRQALRLAYLAAILGLLLALALGAAFVASQLAQPLSGDEIVHASQALYPNPPPFDMTVRRANGTLQRFRFDGHGRLRIDFLEETTPGENPPPGSYRIQTATQEAAYDAADNSWFVNEIPAPRPALFSMSPLNWIAPRPFRPPEPPPGYDCPAWQRADDGQIAGRPAFHVTCGPVGFWIDRESMLVVASDPQPDISEFQASATELSVGALATDLFAIEQPSGTWDAANPPASYVLGVGAPAPGWTGTLDDGGPFDSRTLRGRPAALYFWADWCEPCLSGSLDAFAAAARTRDDVGFVSVSWQPTDADALRRAVEASGGGYPVVLDTDNAITHSWGLTSVPALVLLDADGRVASVTVGPLTTSDLDRMLKALVAGAPVPTPVPVTPAPATPQPVPTVLASAPPSGAPASSTLHVGDPLPDFDGVLADKQGDISSSALAGRPTLLLVVSDNCPACVTMLDELESRYAAHHERTNLVGILWGSTSPGLDEAMTGGGYRHAVTFQDGRLAAGLPVVWDDCACLSTHRLGLTSVPAYVFVDASGHVAGIHLGPSSQEALDTTLDALERGTALPGAS